MVMILMMTVLNGDDDRKPAIYSRSIISLLLINKKSLENVSMDIGVSPYKFTGRPWKRVGAAGPVAVFSRGLIPDRVIYPNVGISHRWMDFFRKIKISLSTDLC